MFPATRHGQKRLSSERGRRWPKDRDANRIQTILRVRVMNSTSIGNVSYPLSRGHTLGAARGSAVGAREVPIGEDAPGLRRLGHRPRQAHAVLTYGIATLQRTSVTGANIDIYV